jgi:membrane protein required for colicin V production
MTLFDYIVIFILVCSVVISLFRGLVRELLSLLSWVIALIVANAFSETLAAWLPDWFPGQILRLFIAFIALFIGVRLLMSLLMKAVDAMMEASRLNTLDRGLGSIFGFIRGCLLVMSLVLVCGLTEIPQQAFWKNAMLSPVVVSSVEKLMPLMPGKVTEHVKF